MSTVFLRAAAETGSAETLAAIPAGAGRRPRSYPSRTAQTPMVQENSQTEVA